MDVETTGTSPDRAAVIQIAAVRFNTETRAIDHNFFNRCLAIPTTRFWQEDTRSWWMKQKRSVLQGIFDRMEDPRLVMSDFQDWVGFNSGLHFLSKPLSFDFPFVASYATEFGPGYGMPFSHQKGRDLRSMMSAMAPDFDEGSVAFEGDQHDALFDCLHQIKLLFAAMDHAQGHQKSRL